MSKKFVLGTILFFILTGAFAAQVEVFAAIPFAISDEYDESPPSMSVGLGFGFTSLDKGESFGIMMNGVIDYHLLNGSFAPEFVSPVGYILNGVSPIGLDFLFGCTAVPLNTKYVTLPITIALHTRLAFNEGSTDMDLGIGGTVGANFWTKKVGIFIRGLVYLDFTRVRFNYGAPVESIKLSAFGVTPQVGVTIPLGKKPAATQ
jgi:hypothetical protein